VWWAVTLIMASCVAARSTTAPPSTSATPPPTSAVAGCPNDSLRTLAAARGFGLGIGATADASLYPVRDARAKETLRCHATILTDNAFYWSVVEPTRGSFRFERGDEIVAYARANGIDALRGHVLVWHQSLPAWLEQGHFTPDELKGILKEHIQTIVGHYRGTITAWDVLNEAVDDKGELRQTIWTKTIGTDVIEMAFRWAHETDPDALLFYNDYRNEGSGPVPDRIYALVRDLRTRGVPIGGVGLQMHLIGGRETAYVTRRAEMLAAMAANMKRLADLGVVVQITEMDVSVVGLPGPDVLAQQATIYADVLGTCLAAPRCTALLTWGLDDGHTWVTGRFSGSERAAPLLFDRDLMPKPAHDAVKKVLARSR
jgi:endo-1,4-beta-xylanase